MDILLDYSIDWRCQLLDLEDLLVGLLLLMLSA